MVVVFHILTQSKVCGRRAAGNLYELSSWLKNSSQGPWWEKQTVVMERKLDRVHTPLHPIVSTCTLSPAVKSHISQGARGVTAVFAAVWGCSQMKTCLHGLNIEDVSQACLLLIEGSSTSTCIHTPTRAIYFLRFRDMSTFLLPLIIPSLISL